MTTIPKLTIKEFLKSRASFLLLQLFFLFLLLLFLFSVGNTMDTLVFIGVTWILFSFIIYGVQYYKRKRQWILLEKSIQQLEQKYLISEIITPPTYLEAQPYYDLLKQASKSMREEILRIRQERREYKEYIEQWVHEIKTPIASIKLIEENHKSDISYPVLQELAALDMYVEQALFYARSEEVEKDYLIKEMNLEPCVEKVIIKNKHLFLLNQIDITLQDLNQFVFCDEKWLAFIINQIILNSIQYRKCQDPQLSISTKTIRNGIQLLITDNGIGIPSSEISRVFDKGFTGMNGRSNKKSTGLGLYLCKKLCKKLGLLIQIESIENEYTTVIITFPKGSHSNF